MLYQIFSKALTYIANKSFSQGCFPEQMKIAKVLPLYKNGDRELFTNYRPVSLLPQFSKIIEKLFANRLDSFINKHGQINNCQYGFRQNKSASLGLIEYTEEISNSIDNKNYYYWGLYRFKKSIRYYRSWNINSKIRLLWYTWYC